MRVARRSGACRNGAVLASLLVMCRPGLAVADVEARFGVEGFLAVSDYVWALGVAAVGDRFELEVQWSASSRAAAEWGRSLRERYGLSLSSSVTYVVVNGLVYADDDEERGLFGGLGVLVFNADVTGKGEDAVGEPIKGTWDIGWVAGHVFGGYARALDDDKHWVLDARIGYLAGGNARGDFTLDYLGQHESGNVSSFKMESAVIASASAAYYF